MGEAKVKEAATETKKVKIKLLRDCYVSGQIQKAGQVVECTEEEAVEFCDRKIKGYQPFYGYMPEMLISPNPLEREIIVRATRVA